MWLDSDRSLVIYGYYILRARFVVVVVAALAGMVTHTDEMIGEIIAALKGTSQWENTLIFFSAGAF